MPRLTKTIQPDETMVPLAKKIDELQNAVNLYAIVNWFATVAMPLIKNHSPATDDFNSHPFVRAFASKFASLTNLNGYNEAGISLEQEAFDALNDLINERPATYEVR